MPIISKSKFGGNYLYPMIFISDVLAKEDFFGEKLWQEDRKSWGNIAFCDTHTSYPPIIRKDNKRVKFNSDIYISTDGLIATELTAPVTSDKEAVILLSHHINSFLGIMFFGGIFLFPFVENQIRHIAKEENIITTWSGSVVTYSGATMPRTMHRYKKPNNMIQVLDHYSSADIRKVEEINRAVNVGKKIVNSFLIREDSQILALAACKEYTLQNWNNALLFAWTFIEMLMDALWKKEIINKISKSDAARVQKLNDYRTYSVSIKLEFLYEKGVINQTTYTNINKLKKIRDGFIHRGRMTTEADINVFFDVIKYIVKIVTGYDPQFYKQSLGWAGGWLL